MKKNRWVYLGGSYGALWGSLLPLNGLCFLCGACMTLLHGRSRGNLFLAILLASIGIFLVYYCIKLWDRFYLWAKFGDDGLFLRGLFLKKSYKRYDRYKDAGICKYVHGEEDPGVKRLTWIYLTTDVIRPLYVRNIYRMPMGTGGIRIPFTEARYAHLIAVLPGELSDRLRMSYAKCMKE